MNKENIIYRVFNKKGRYHQSYSPKLKDAKIWAIDCAAMVKGFLKEDVLNDKGDTISSEIIFSSKKNTDENKKNKP